MTHSTESTLVVDGKVGRFQAGEALEQVGPILLCQGIHSAVEGR